MPILEWGLSQTPPFPLESFVGVGGGKECCPAGLSLVQVKGYLKLLHFLELFLDNSVGSPVKENVSCGPMLIRGLALEIMPSQHSSLMIAPFLNIICYVMQMQRSQQMELNAQAVAFQRRGKSSLQCQQDLSLEWHAGPPAWQFPARFILFCTPCSPGLP